MLDLHRGMIQAEARVQPLFDGLHHAVPFETFIDAGMQRHHLPRLRDRPHMHVVHVNDTRHTGDEIGPERLPLETSRAGVFAVGDVRASSVKRVAASVGDGAQAVAAIHKYLAAIDEPAVALQPQPAAAE